MTMNLGPAFEALPLVEREEILRLELGRRAGIRLLANVVDGVASGSRESLRWRIDAAVALVEHTGSDSQKRTCDALAPIARRALRFDPDTHPRRRQLFDAWEGACAYCGRRTLIEDGHVEHVVPLACGGADADHNLVWACVPCNLSKNAQTPLEWLGNATGDVDDTCRLLAHRKAMRARRESDESEREHHWVVAAIYMLTWVMR